MTPIFGITGWKNSGKTTLTERLVSELTGRGLKIATVKHAHGGFDIDKAGTDSFRHRAAGAGETAIVSARRWALMHELADEEEPRLEDITSRMAPADLILVEGYKREDHLKVEARRLESRDRMPMAPEEFNIVAVAADHEVSHESLPVFDLDDIPAIADFIMKTMKIEAPGG